jgi:DNA repair protein SbcC/Rad50
VEAKPAVVVESDPRLIALRERLGAARAQADAGGAVDADALAGEVTALSAELALSENEASALQQDLNRLRRAIDAQVRAQQEAAAESELGQLRTAIAEQQALPAKQSLDRLDGLRKSLKGLPRSIRSDYAELRAEALKLIDWQRWSNNEIRRRLCDEVAALPAAGLHPDAVATRIRELQNEWRRVDALEGIDPKAPARGLGRRFNALVHETLKPARPYFEKRAELRRERTDALTEATSGLEEQLAKVADDRAALLALRRTLGDSFRKLDEVDPRQRRALSQRLRADLTAVDASLSNQAERVELAKRQLIAELRRDLAAIAPEQRADRAKRAQQAWKQLGSGDRKRDQLQWIELRELVDPIFLDVHAARAEEQAADQAKRDEIDALLGAVENALAEPDPNAHALEQLHESTRLRLSEIAPLDRASERRADELLERLLKCKIESERHLRLGAYSALATRAARLDRIEQQWLKGDGLEREALQELVEHPPLSQPALQQALEQRRDRLLQLAGETDEAPMAEVLQALEAQHQMAEQLLLECEFHCGIDSPEAQRKARMDLQVRRLADRMSGSDANSPADEASRLWATWFSIGPLESAARTTLAERFSACRKGLEDSLG